MSFNDMNISIIDLKLPPVTLDHLSTGELETMWEAGNRILGCCRVLEKNDAQELLHQTLGPVDRISAKNNQNNKRGE